VGGGSGGWARRVGRLVLFVGLQALLVAGLLELAARIFDPLGISFYPQSAAYFDHFVLEEPLGYRNRPGLQGEFWGAPVRINSLGMRDREVGAKAAGEFRVMVLGDSIPFGIGVTEEQALPRQLERVLDETAPAGLHYRTLNMGVPSYNTEQQWIQLQTLGPRLAPDLVLLLFAFNDIQPKMWVLDKRRSPIVNLSQRSYAASFLAVLARRARSAAGGADTRVAGDAYRAGDPRWQAVEGALGAIARHCRERGIPFVVFTHFGATEPPFPLLAEVGRKEDFPVMTLSPWEDPRWAGLDPVDFQNSPSDSHPNAAGCRLYADVLLAGLERAGVLPQP
jgi:lysophospholipase L1-like esterase